MGKELKIFDMDYDRAAAPLGEGLITIPNNRVATLSVSYFDRLHGATIVITQDKLREMACWILENTEGKDTKKEVSN